MAYFSEFSTSGCRISDGTRARVGGLVDLELEPQPVAEAQLLDAEVEVQRVDFLAQRDLFHRILVERVAQEIRQAPDRLVRDLALAVEDQRRDRIQRVEQEMGIELVAQHLDLRFLRERSALSIVSRCCCSVS
jgi:hypothetical protein